MDCLQLLSTLFGQNHVYKWHSDEIPMRLLDNHNTPPFAGLETLYLIHLNHMKNITTWMTDVIICDLIWENPACSYFRENPDKTMYS